MNSSRQIFLEVKSKVKHSQEPHGGVTKSVVHENGHKYICVGNQTKRAEVGIWCFHSALHQTRKQVAGRIMRYFRGVEHLFEMFVDTAEIRIIHDAIEFLKAETFVIPNEFPCKIKTKENGTTPMKKATCGKDGEDICMKAGIYGAFASGINAYLAAHIDKDYTYSVTSVHVKSKYRDNDQPVAYFAFPLLGIAIPLRPGDVLFFNPEEPHCISSCNNEEDEIYCVSLYLKSDNIGQNNNSKELSPNKESFLEYFHEVKRN